MRWKALAWLGGLGLAIAGCQPRVESRGDVLVRHHFAGFDQISANPELEVVKAVLALPESKRLRDEASAKIAVHMPTWFGVDLGGATNHAPALLPWVRAALDHESYLEVLGKEGRVGSWAVAVRLDAAAATGLGGSVRGVLAPMLSGGTAAGAAGGEAAQWELSGKAGARFAHLGEWAILGSGRGAFESIQDRIGKMGAPVPKATNYVFRLDAELGKLAGLLGWRPEPAAPVPQWPGVRLVVEPRKGRLRSTAELMFDKPHGLKLEPWALPASKLMDPLVGFTAIQGADNWLGRLPIFTPYGVTEWPKQFFLWSVAGDPWNQYLAGPMQAPTNLMAKLSLPVPMSLVSNMSWRAQVFGLRITNQAMRVEFRGLPYLLPFLESIREAGGTQLYGGLFPQPPKGEPAPAGLLQQVTGRTNLVLYDWETTGRSVLWTNSPGTAGPRVSTNPVGRLVQFKQLGQYWRLMMNTNSSRLPMTREGEIWVPGWDWINAAQSRLGDTITEVTLSGPNQLSLVRQSQLGFNALELSYLLQWIENPGFPGWSDAPFIPAGVRTLTSPPTPGGASKP